MHTGLTRPLHLRCRWGPTERQELLARRLGLLRYLLRSPCYDGLTRCAGRPAFFACCACCVLARPCGGAVQPPTLAPAAAPPPPLPARRPVVARSVRAVSWLPLLGSLGAYGLELVDSMQGYYTYVES